MAGKKTKATPADRDQVGRKLPTSNEFNVPCSVDRLSRYIKSVKLDSLDQVRRHFDSLIESYWVFRGQADSRWSLTTSLERAATWQQVAVDCAESQLISAFKSQAHLYESDVPPFENDLDWVALMQHHGCPTRLLDFTRSPYIALYFAIERAEANRSCAVWAVNGAACNERAINRIQSLQQHTKEQVFNQKDFTEGNVAGKLNSTPWFRKAFLSNLFPMICTVQPTRHNHRMATQQGCFLCPGDVSHINGFESNFLQQLIMGPYSDYVFPVWNPPQILRFTIPGELRELLIRELKRMNISRASLFPGLDGYATSLGLELDILNGPSRAPLRKLPHATAGGSK